MDSSLVDYLITIEYLIIVGDYVALIMIRDRDNTLIIKLMVATM